MKNVKNKANGEKFFFPICVVLFILFVYGFSVCCYKDFFIWASDNSLYIPTRQFFLQTTQVAGGFLNYLGLFFTQFFLYPFIGSAILSFFLLIIVFLVIKLFNFSPRIYPIAFIPSFALFVSITQTGYLISTLKSPGYIFTNILGIIISLLICWGFKNVLKKYKHFAVYLMPFVIIAAYPLFGFYSLFTAIVCILITFFIIKISLKRSVSLFLIYLSTGLLIPWFTARFIYTEMPWYDSFIAGLPKYYFNLVELPLWSPFIVLFISLLLFNLILLDKVNFLSRGKCILSFSMGVFFLMLSCVYFFSYRNSNFNTELKLLQAIEKNDWEQAVLIREKHDDRPTRLIIMCYNLALHKLGLAGDRMFSVDNNSVLHDFYRKNMITMNYGAKPLYFHYGKINYCYRWCMEEMVEYGMTVRGLKYMVKCALLNDEFSLAKKYNSVLQNTLFHKKWAKKYQQYIENPQLLTEDVELNSVRPLMAYQNQVDRDKYMLEFYILNNFARMKGGLPELVDLSLQFNLIMKNVERFWPRFFLYASLHERIPVHYQEAALLYSYLETEVDLSKFKFDSEVLEKFEKLVSMSVQYADNSEELNRNIFQPLFGKTFWYYYFFITDVKSD